MDEISRTAEALALLLREIVDTPEDLTMTVEELAGGAYMFRVRANPRDVGQLIGTNGRTARSLRLILGAISSKTRRKLFLDLDGAHNER